MKPKTKWKGRFGSLAGADEVAKSLGNMTAAWSYLENQLVYVLIEIANLEPEIAFALMYSANATSAKLDMIRLVLDRLPQDEPYLVSSRSALKQAIALTSQRNSLTHHTWVVNINTGQAYTFDFRQPPNAQARRTTRNPHAIDRFTDEILDACNALDAVIDQVRGHKVSLGLKD